MAAATDTAAHIIFTAHPFSIQFLSESILIFPGFHSHLMLAGFQFSHFNSLRQYLEFGPAVL